MWCSRRRQLDIAGGNDQPETAPTEAIPTSYGRLDKDLECMGTS